MTRFTTARSKVNSRSHHDVAHLLPQTNIPAEYQLPTCYSFPDITGIRFYKSRSLRQDQRSNQYHMMMLHTYNPLTNVRTKYQLPTPYCFQDIARTRFYSPVQRSNQGHTMMLQSSNLQPMSLPSINFLHCTVSEI